MKGERKMLTIAEIEYQHGYYDAMVKEKEGQSFLTQPLSALSTLSMGVSDLRLDFASLERSKFFCVLSGLDVLYREYLLGIQIANKRVGFFSYFERIWNAILNRSIVKLAPDPREIWLEKVAREFAEAFRDAKLVADISIETKDDIGEPRQVMFKALTWK